MTARYAAGCHAEALDEYRALAARLAEVGLQPGPQVRELEAQMLRHADELGPSGRAQHPTNVGARVASIVGREGELTTLAATLRAHRIVTLVGPAGVGKTTLAAEAARALLDRTPDGTWLVELGPLRAAGEVLPAVGNALGIRRVGTGGEGDRDALGVLRERLRAARLLVVLDGAEHLVPDLGPVVGDLAAAGRDVSVLVTSRRPLGVAGEAVVPVRPLDASTAEDLFMERARAALPDWVADAAESEAVTEICRRIDGLPLAVELAAARLRALSAAAIAERLERGLGVLGRGGALQASIEASHALLTTDEQELFRRLSVFAGPFRLEDAEHVGGGDGLDHDAVLDLLVALTEHSMVQAEGGSPRRYRMLEALRDDARARLDDAAAAAAARRHATHFARLAVTTAGAIDRLGAEAVGDPLVPFHWDIDAASRWAVAHAETDLALELAIGMGAFHHLVGTVTLGRELIDEALALARRRSGAADPDDVVADRAAAVRVARARGRRRDRAGAGADRPPRQRSRPQRAARDGGAAGALSGRPRRRRAREPRRLRAGPGARRALHGRVGRVDRRHGRAHGGEPGRRRRAVRHRVRAPDRGGRHLRARQLRGGPRRGCSRPPDGTTKPPPRARARSPRPRSGRSASATRSCCMRPRSPPRAAATSSAPPCSPARR